LADQLPGHVGHAGIAQLHGNVRAFDFGRLIKD
jgi:hypothetical protein